MDENIIKLRNLIKNAENIVFFGGAGVSTESGIPDFRGEKGIYKTREKYGISPEILLSHTYFMENTEKFYEYYKHDFIIPEVKPNKAHYALAKFEREGKLSAVITQNIDNLHQQAGSRNVLELHGSAHRNFCMDCGKFYTLSFILETEGVPKCTVCGGIIKPDVVLYEEGLNNETINRSIKHLSECDMLIIGGTSLVVYPAAGLIRYFKGKNLAVINRDATAADENADICIRGSIGEVLDAI